ncbi:MAG: bifunctional heptose 7-phosphate kinase/heptose 1-phosphate adenyltransferase [Planctomycetes bacterium]|nr:bifunctional heptose 7-phosphate kinase/heptose 1-phosphate adenyltransferase [Planctomycetota bacterium]
MQHDLAHWVRLFHGRRVLLVGDLILDRYLYGDAERISPEAPVPVLKTVEQREALGGAGNVAACLAALGCKVTCCGLVGDDRHGEILRRLLTEIGVDSAAIVSTHDRPTTTKTRLVGLAQHRHRQQLLRVDEEDSSPLADSLSARLLDAVDKSIAAVDVVCIEDYDKGLIGDLFARRVIDGARAQGKPVLVDPARLKNYSRYKGATIVTPNRDELSIAIGRRLGPVAEVGRATEELIVKYDFDAVAATVDRDGAVLAERGRSWRHLPTVPRSVYDNTGAGDAVLAMLAAAVASGADLESAVRLANIAGGLEVEKFGCVPITTDEVLAELRLEHRMQNGKLASMDELVSELQLRRDRGETVAFTNGCFDILHAGHVDFLKRCRQQASVLVVGLNSDASVRSLNKGVDRPINKFEHRGAVLGAMECVDYVVGFEESDPENLIRKLRPDVLIKGEDWAKKGVKGREFVESYGGRIVLLPLLDGLSTTRLIERINESKRPS